MITKSLEKKLGERTFRPENPPVILGSASAVGKKEGEGPLGADFDIRNDDSFFGEDTWEKAESQIQSLALGRAVEKAELSLSDMDFVFAGDLLNQCAGSTFGLRDANIPFFGVYGACSTMSETLCFGAMAIDGGFAERVACITSSHYCSAERQFRMPLEYGGQRTPTSQWTVTGAGAVILGRGGAKNANGLPKITHFTSAKIIDAGIKDANNMGAAMAPAAYDTLSAHFRDTGRSPDYYDLILTGDLGRLGHDILVDFFAKDSIKLNNYNDCGLMIYDVEGQDVHAGGSGCGCSATVLCGHILRKMNTGELRRVLFAATGAMMSTTSSQQGESIPSICYAVAIEV
ncbi:MAG: stage V sporulation protein AD [Oscillospiraceae bacterium]|jgi:stage V sporulation protein AD|nr:stage V sporulation protein AD [Oscillospiraceae bacterium]